MRGSGPAELCAAIDVCVPPGRIQHMREPADGQQEARGFARPLWNGRVWSIPSPRVPQGRRADLCRHRSPAQALRGRLDPARRADAPRCSTTPGSGRSRRGPHRRAHGPRRHQPRRRAASVPARCGPWSASGPITTCIVWRPSWRARLPTSAMWRFAAASAWRRATRTSRPATPGSLRQGWHR